MFGQIYQSNTVAAVKMATKLLSQSQIKAAHLDEKFKHKSLFARYKFLIMKDARPKITFFLCGLTFLTTRGFSSHRTTHGHQQLYTMVNALLFGRLHKQEASFITHDDFKYMKNNFKNFQNQTYDTN